MKKILAILILLVVLAGCWPTAFLAGAAGAGAIIYDNRSMEVMIDDRNITHQAQLQIDADDMLKDNTHISVATFNHIVLLVGQVATKEQKDRAEGIIKNVPEVKRIYNQITIEPPISYKARSEDSYITTKVKAAMLTQAGLRSTQMKIVTENGVVYIMGLTTRSQGNLAAETVRKVTGVKKVVKLLEYLQ